MRKPTLLWETGSYLGMNSEGARLTLMVLLIITKLFSFSGLIWVCVSIGIFYQ